MEVEVQTRGIVAEALGEDSQECPRLTVVAQDTPVTLHVKVAVGANSQSLREDKPAAAAGDEGADETPRRAMVAQHLVVHRAADQEMARAGGGGQDQGAKSYERGAKARQADAPRPLHLALCALLQGLPERQRLKNGTVQAAQDDSFLRSRRGTE